MEALTSSSSSFSLFPYRLVGLVVKASTLRAANSL